MGKPFENPVAPVVGLHCGAFGGRYKDVWLRRAVGPSPHSARIKGGLSQRSRLCFARSAPHLRSGWKAPSAHAGIRGLSLRRSDEERTARAFSATCFGSKQ